MQTSGALRREIEASHSTVIVRLVRNCALGRTIQYAAASRFNHCRQCLLDAPPSRGMTSHDTSLSVAFGALKVLRSVGL